MARGIARNLRRRPTPAEASRRTNDRNQFVSPELEPRVEAVPPEQRRLPSVSDLKLLTVKERADLLQRFGIMEKWDQLSAEAMAYVSRMTGYPKGSEQWNAAVDDLTNMGSKRALLGMNRKAYREIAMIDAMDGDINAEFIRMSEGDDRQCDVCASLAGEQGDYAYHEAIGLPGGASCEGGQYCRCQLIRIISE